jgi:NAD(P)-dependent dehydrogenase (short-subunit alcohol dehydrogenase family)
MALLRAALPTFNANSEGGAMVITSSVAGTSIGGSSMAYCVTKAAQLHLMRCLAQTQGSKVRINAVLPGLLLTEWVSLLLFLGIPLFYMSGKESLPCGETSFGIDEFIAFLGIEIFS